MWEKPTHNHEGYLDMTAYLAMKNMYKGEYKMTGWNDGDIIKLHLADGRDVYRVILKAHGKYATTVNLYDTENAENEYKVKPEKTIMHADLGRIAFTKAYDLDSGQFIRAMEEKEFDRFKSRIGEVLGIPSISVPEEEPFLEERSQLKKQVAELEQKNSVLASKNSDYAEKLELASGNSEDLESARRELTAVKDELAKAMAKLNSALEESAKAEASVIKAEAERDVYKDLYKQVLVKHDL